MTVSQYLKRQLDFALNMLDDEMKRIGIPERGDRNILIPQEGLVTNSVMLIQNVMGIVLFEKNRHLLAPLYKCDIGIFEAMEPLTEFDDVPVKSIKILCYGTPTVAPTLTTKYGDIILGLSGEAVAMIYQQLAATVDLRPKVSSEGRIEGDNVIHAQFGKQL